ncbi:hypothetical protein PAXRUDRAFT_211647 [Paxillus rubicundulus Ve08.2h10]|uniref:Uncharacterized protein n=1 Tax=Paxillus rubicundulus Ve08.2h10 TaxID=930991 RepID=A0A0D0DHC9_9AGAM|nr:hypothetical protein PAXRUDRAFT_211647 [Paxillus rubicundulus Ve08.2h10]
MARCSPTMGCRYPCPRMTPLLLRVTRQASDLRASSGWSERGGSREVGTRRCWKVSYPHGRLEEQCAKHGGDGFTMGGHVQGLKSVDAYLRERASGHRNGLFNSRDVASIEKVVPRSPWPHVSQLQ